MIRRLPVLPTIIVIAAALTMVALGVWQLGRAEEKADLLAAYDIALSNETPIDWPTPDQYDASLYRVTTVECLDVKGIDSIGGKSARGQTGWVHIARCSHEGRGIADVTLGWSRGTEKPDWKGGEVSGRIAPFCETVRLIAAEPVAGLEPLAQPDPSDLPNNHLAYAGQWFFFALTALVIYGIAVRSRLK